MSGYHIPVLLEESISALISDPCGVYADATFGGGGHTAAILSRLAPSGRVIAFDRDADAIGNAPEDRRLTLIRSNFRFIHNYVEYFSRKNIREPGNDTCSSTDSTHPTAGTDLGMPDTRSIPDNIYGNTDGIPSGGLDGIIADLGVSSHQFDTPERGFSFRFDAPLDMRMDSRAKLTAADIANTYPEEDIERILKLYGEVDNSRKTASLICRARQSAAIATTGDLCRAVSGILPKYAEHKVLAKIFQALRIEVNQEMASLEKFLYGAGKSLRKGGRLAVITYHSLEDRMVKNFIRTGHTDGTVTKDIYGNTGAAMRPVNRKPTVPSEEEISSNTRARSAKLRIAEKI